MPSPAAAPASPPSSSSHATSDRLVVVSNRLPIVLDRDDDGWNLEPGSGGLVSALAPALSERGGTWIGWPGRPVPDDGGWRRAMDTFSGEQGYDLAPVPLTEDEVDGFYFGFSNGVLWPLFHDLVGRTNFEPAFWHSYVRVNQKYGRAIVESTTPDDFVWVHDYQLMLAGRHVRREAGDEDRRLGFFLHIPFPPVDIFLRLPWRRQILDALLAYDLIGFQTHRDRNNFLACLETLESGALIEDVNGTAALSYEGRSLRAGAFPIGIDAEGFERRADSDDVTSRIGVLRSEIGPQDIILGVDRLDYTKGLPERLMAFRDALERYEDLHEKVVLTQIVVPSREQVPEYQTLKRRIERMVGEINGAFSTPGWTPVQYIYRSISPTDLAALYRMARISLVTSLKDGMNLVAKEFCACQVDAPGNLVLSEFAGAADQLGDGAILVNPHDVEHTADALIRALEMDEGERHRRMEAMREVVARENIFHWLQSFLDAARG